MEQDTPNPGGFWRKAFDIGPYRFGVERSRVQIGGLPYLDRYILYVGIGTLRLHRFHRGDDDRASHTHPWWFVTFPFSTYLEATYRHGAWQSYREVKAWRFHKRPANFEHIVLGKAKRLDDYPGFGYELTPFWTFVITGQRTNAWGFYPEQDKFIPWQEYK